MPKKFKPFDVMKDTGARERLSKPATILYGQIGSPPDRLNLDRQVAWLDLVEAAAPGVLERSDRMYLEATACTLSDVRRGTENKTTVKLLGTWLRKMWLTPGAEPTPEATLSAFKGGGRIQ